MRFSAKVFLKDSDDPPPATTMAILKGLGVRWSDGRDEAGQHWLVIEGTVDESGLQAIVDALKNSN